ncbi:hypothetical protein [Geodermatophilus sp. CPCC 205761]|uniref:hypothetical protein n=1 Tax=Geodermatophilus sp. CPCC 205761 TaxID=2936597 RepID=UPI003EEC2016
MSLLPIGRHRTLRAGDVVEVRPAEEILATLDRDATVDRLPFQPEMLAHCGSRFTVASRADTTCFYGTLRRLEGSVHLTGLRCDGSAHGGCQAGCLFFWKEEWLRPVADQDHHGVPLATTPPRDRAGCTEEDLVRAVHPPGAAPDGDELWSCQATQVRAATTPIRPWDLRHYVSDVRNGNVRLRAVLRYFLPSQFNIYQGISRYHLPRWLRLWRGAPVPFVHGRLEKTPSITLGLQPGDRVRIRSREEIRATLDRSARNRGLSFDVEQVPYCGQTRRVQRVVSRIIDEWTGRMLELPGRCLVLDGVVCRGIFHGLCQRQTDSYWREAWLDREEPVTGDAPAARGRAGSEG